MGHRWESCPAIMLIEGRGLVLCWFPPSPGQTLCSAHHSGSNVVAGETELRAIIMALLKQIDIEAELSEFLHLRDGPQYELRVGLPGVLAKWVIVPESLIRIASVDLTARRALRDLLATIVLVQQAQHALDRSSELLLADSRKQHALPSRRFVPDLDPTALSRDPAAGAAPKWILIADDDDAIREVWTEILRLNGYRVLTARNGLEALEVMGAVVPDLILLDLRMPEIDGPTFLTMLEGAPGLRRMPVLIVSGFLEDESPRASLGLNIVGRLSKPLLQADLLAAVQTALAPAARHV